MRPLLCPGAAPSIPFAQSYYGRTVCLCRSWLSLRAMHPHKPDSFFPPLLPSPFVERVTRRQAQLINRCRRLSDGC
jgi:hypothetical protein